MAVGVLHPSPQFVKWSQDARWFIAHNANQTDASAMMFSGVVSPDSAVYAKVRLGYDWTQASGAGDEYKWRIYLAESSTSIDDGNPIFGGGWQAASVVGGAASPQSVTNVEFMIPKGFFLKCTMDGEAGVTPRFFLATGMKV